MKIVIEEPAGITRTDWPVARGLPFLPGELRYADHLVLLNPAGEMVPTQTRVLSFWPDQSIKWLLVVFQVNIRAQTTQTYTLEISNHSVNPDKLQQIMIDEEGDTTFAIHTGALDVLIDLHSGFRIFNQVRFGDNLIFSDDGWAGFQLVDLDGVRYSSLNGKVTRFVWEETGPLRAVLFVAGDHCDIKGQRLFSYEARLIFHAGLNWCELEYTFINDENADQTTLKQVSVSLSPDLGDETTGLVGAFQRKFKSDRPFLIYADEPVQASFFSGTKIFDFEGLQFEYEQPGEMLRNVAHGWMDISDSQQGVMVCVKNLSLMAPKAIAYDSDKIEVQFWPARTQDLNLPQGMARTHRMMVLFHEGSGAQAEVNQLATSYEIDLCPSIVFGTGPIELFGPVFKYMPKKHPKINIRLRGQFNSFMTGNFGTGFFDFGDSDQELTGNRAGYMSNNECDLPLSMAFQFLRTGERDYFDALSASAWHMMDIDFVHHAPDNPIETGGVRIHGVNHIQHNCEGMPGFTIATSHMWTEGLLAYYLLTGHPTALSRAVSIGNCLINLIDSGWAIPPYKVPWHGVRDSAWPIIALAALYEVTYQQRWLDNLVKLADFVVDLQHPDGGWDLRIGWYNGTRVPLQIGIGMNGLNRAHSLTGDERYLAASLQAAEKLKHSVFPEGNFMYIDAPGYRWNYSTPVVLEALGYLWQNTGDQSYLEFANQSMRAALKPTKVNGTALAYAWRSLLRYLSWADQSGLLRDEV